MRLRLLAALLVVALLGAARPAAAQSLALPVVVHTEGVVVRAEAGMEAPAARTARRARAALAAIAADLPGLAVPRWVEIRLVKRSEDLAAAAPPGRSPPPWAIGVAYPEDGVVVVAYRRGPVPADLDSVVVHELAHLALGAALGRRAPRWLHEGFAYLHSSDFSLDRTRTLTGMAWSGNVIPLADLDRSFPAAENEAARAYAQSYDFVAYLARRGRSLTPDDDGNRWAFRDFLVALGDGATLEQAARKSFSAGMSDLFDEWRESLRDRYFILPAGMLGLFVWVVAAVLLVLAFLRKRRLGRATLARWAEEEAAAAHRVEATPVVDAAVDPAREPDPPSNPGGNPGSSSASS
jgi:hypothetical protein